MLSLAALGLAAAAPASAASCRFGAERILGREVAKHFVRRTLADLAARIPDAAVTLFIEHALSDDDNVERTVKLNAVDGEIARLEKEAAREAPLSRATLAGMSCSRMVCSFGPSSVLHNNLYLKSLTFARIGGCLVVTRMHLLDGD